MGFMYSVFFIIVISGSFSSTKQSRFFLTLILLFIILFLFFLISFYNLSGFIFLLHFLALYCSQIRKQYVSKSRNNRYERLPSSALQR